MEQGQPSTSCAFLAQGSLVAGRYRIIRTLGAGGMASVYLAHDEVLGDGTQVALKILKQSAGLTEAQGERFLREVRLTHKINHENVVRTFDFGQERDIRFYTMEYLSGQTLSAFMHEREQLPLPTILRLALQIVRGIVAMHSVGVTHRDLKPDNIMVIDSMRVKITDFGVARGDGSLLTLQADEILGTIAYLAPETLLGEKATNAVDYYSFGAILYELLTGRLPIEEESPAMLIMRKIEEQPADPRGYRKEIPDWLAEGVLDLLHANPAERLAGAKEFIQALLAHAPVDDSNDLITASLGVQISELPTKVVSDRSTYDRILSLYKTALPIGRLSMLCLSALLGLVLCWTDFAAQLEYQQLDNLFRIRGTAAPSKDVAIVSIDEASYMSLGVSMADAWPRSLHTKLLNRMYEYGAKKIVFDILFVNPSSDPQVDEAFAEALGKLPTVLGASLGTSLQATANGSFTLEQMIRPLPRFEQKAAGIGVVGFPNDHLRIRSFYAKRSELFPDVGSLAEAATGTVLSGEKPGPRDLINYYGPAASIKRFSYHDVIADEQRIPPDAFRGKVVFVGLNLQSRVGPSQRESFVSPYDSAVFGTEIHATAASNILKRDWIRRVSDSQEGFIQYTVVLVCMLVLCFLKGRALLVAMGGLLGVLLAIQCACFQMNQFIPLLAPVVLGLVLGGAARLLFHTNSKVRKRRWS